MRDRDEFRKIEVDETKERVYVKEEVKIDARDEVIRFANEMEEKLKKKDSKGGWRGCSVVYLLIRIQIELAELSQYVLAYEEEQNDSGVVSNYTRKQVIGECCDVANYAMMLADNMKKSSA